MRVSRPHDPCKSCQPPTPHPAPRSRIWYGVPGIPESVPEPSDGGSAPTAEVDLDFVEYARCEAEPDFDSQVSPFEP